MSYLNNFQKKTNSFLETDEVTDRKVHYYIVPAE